MTTAWAHLPNAKHIDRVLASVTANLTLWVAARDAVLALIAYDDCAHMLDSDVSELKILVALGVPPAILLLPACIVFAKEKELA